MSGAGAGELRRRTASALVAVAVGLACLWLGGVAWRALVLATGAALLWEWLGLWRRMPGRPATLGSAGVAAIVLAGVLLDRLRHAPATGLRDVLFLLVVVWATDIAAYTAGKLGGGPALAPAISPGKTWAGAAGGLVAAGLAALVFAGAIGAAGPGPVLVGLLLGATTQLGDLLESAAKRVAGVKDSGWLMPGHGGLLDRLDGMLAATLLAGLLAILFGREVVFPG